MCPWSSPGTNHSAFPSCSPLQWSADSTGGRAIQSLHPLSSCLCEKGEGWWPLPCYLRALSAWVSHAGLKGDPQWLFASCKNAQQSCSFVPGDQKCGRALEIPAHVYAVGICLFAPCACGYPADAPPPKGCLPRGTDSTTDSFCWLFPLSPSCIRQLLSIFLLPFNLLAVYTHPLWGDVKLRWESSPHGKPKWVSVSVQSLNCGGKLPSGKGPWGLASQPAEHEPTMWSGGQEGQEHPGLHQE